MNIGNVGPDITREHPEYAAKRAMWRQYRDLYAGGAQFIANATVIWSADRKNRVTSSSSG